MANKRNPQTGVEAIEPQRGEPVTIVTGSPVVPGQTVSGLPVPHLTTSVRQAFVYYTITPVDRRGRLADASPLRFLHWRPGLAITMTMLVGAVIVAPDPAGPETVTRQGHLRLPADLRHALRLATSDRLLVAAYADRGLVLAFPMPTLDAMVSGYQSSVMEPPLWTHP